MFLLGHGTVSLVRICWLFVYCCRYHCFCVGFIVVVVVLGFFKIQSSLHLCNGQWAQKVVFDIGRRAHIVTLHGGYTDRYIAATLCCSKTAVPNAIVKFNADDTFHDTRKIAK